MQKEIETKLARARTKLIMDKPFLGALVLRLLMLAAEPKWCPTTATDARRFYYISLKKFLRAKTFIISRAR